MCRKIFYTMGDSVEFPQNLGNSLKFSNNITLIAWKNVWKDPLIYLVDVIEWNWNILYKWIFGIICPRVIIVTLAKNFMGSVDVRQIWFNFVVTQNTITLKANDYHTAYQTQWLTVIRHLVAKHATQHSIHVMN
jgi:hypothetical protein